MPIMQPEDVVERIGLGTLLRPAEALKTDELSPVWKLETDTGIWVVKTSKPWGDYWLGVVAQAGALETAAWRAGLDMPEPFIPASTETGLWHPIGEGHFAKAVRFLEGAPA